MFRISKSLERLLKRGILRILTLFIRQSETQTRTPLPSNIRSVLIMRIDGKMGNMILTLPLMQASKKLFRNAHLAILIDKSQEQLVEENPYIDECIVIDLQRLIYLPWRWCSFLRRIRGFDLVVECSNPGSLSVSHAFLLVISGAPYRLGFERDLSYRFLNLLVKTNENQHYREMMLDLIRFFQISPEVDERNIFLTDEEMERGGVLINKNESTCELKRIGIWVGARYGKQWPMENYFRVGNYLENKTPVRVFYFFGPEEIDEYENSINQKYETSRLFTSVRMLSAAVSHCDLFIGGDTGPLHLSACIGIPTLGIFRLPNLAAYSYENGKNLRTLYLPDLDEPIDEVINVSLEMLENRQ